VADADPDRLVPVDPPLPVKIAGWHGSPEGLLLGWRHSPSGYLDGWSAIVRFPLNGVGVVGGINPNYLDDDRSRRPFVFEWRNTAPPPSDNSSTCSYCR
jgi:hypothetical protein